MNGAKARLLAFDCGKSCAEAIANGIPREQALNAAAYAMLDMGNDKSVAAFVPSLALAWSEQGFPTVEPSHKLAASLMATSIPREHVEDFVRMPWRCFAFMIPDGLLGRESCFVLAVKSRTTGHIHLLGFHENYLHFGDEASLADWNLKVIGSRPGGDDILITQEECERGAKLTELSGRLFLGICLEMSQYRPTGSSTPTAYIKRTTKEGVSPSVFKLTRDVKVDVRRAVRDYVDGKRSASPTVRVLVRGHWKMQVHGLGKADRKLIHIEPYWRGEESAPAAVRSHLLNGEDT